MRSTRSRDELPSDASSEQKSTDRADNTEKIGANPAWLIDCGIVKHAVLEIEMSSAAEQATDALTQWVTFKLENETYGVNVMDVQEVLRVTDIAPVPGAPSFVLGIINLRGNVVSVLDTRRRFGLKQVEVDDATRIIIIESAGQTVGMRVDAVAEVLDVDSSEIESSPDVGNDESSRYISGMVSRGDELVILIDVNKIITEGI